PASYLHSPLETPFRFRQVGVASIQKTGQHVRESGASLISDRIVDLLCLRVEPARVAVAIGGPGNSAHRNATGGLVLWREVPVWQCQRGHADVPPLGEVATYFDEPIQRGQETQTGPWVARFDRPF